MPARLGSAVPGEVLPSIDLELIRQRAIDRANAEVPHDIRQLSPEECRAKLRQMGGLAKLVMREPGEDTAEDVM